MSIAEIAVKRPLLIIVIFLVLILFGMLSYSKLNYKLLPNIEVASVTVSTIYPGASASEVENAVTRKLEDVFASVEGLEKISSTSQEGVSQISVQLKSGTNIDKAERDIQRKADQAQNQLPEGIDRPVVSKINLEEAPVVRAGVTSSLAPRALFDLVDQQLRPVLQNITGVGQVNIIGGDKREIQVNVDQGKLKAYGLSITQVSEAIKNANQSFPAGRIETRDQQYAIQFEANVDSVDQISNFVISQVRGKGSIYLKDIASVMDATAEQTAINHINGLPSIGIQIIKQTDANAVNVSKEVRAQFADIEKQYKAQSLKFTISSDQSVYTLRSADAVMEDLVMAIVIVGLVMLAFMHSIRSSLFVMVALPSSIIPTFIVMYFMGFSLNLMTLMAMSLVVGILVDDSIVVLENVYRHMEMGADRRKAALDGRNEIGFTALAITLVDVVVFLPLAVSGGIIGAILKEFSLVVVISTLMSLFVSFTITPMLASRFGRLEHLNKKTLWGRINLGFEHIIDEIKDMYGKALEIVLYKKRWLLSGVIVLIIASLMLLGKGFIGATFIPAGDQGELLINLELSPTATLYQTNMVTQEVEKMIMKQPEVDKVFSSIGFVSGGVAGTGNNSNRAELTVTLKDASQRSVTAEQFGISMQRKLSSTIAGVKVTASPTSITGSGAQAPIQIAVKGVDQAAVRRIAEQYMAVVASVPGAQFVQLSVKDKKPQVEVKLNREKMALLGINAGQVGAALQNAFTGNDQSKFKEAGNEYDILVGLGKYNRSNINDVRNLPFANSDGQTFVLSQFADVQEGMGESMLQRSDRLNSITVTSNVTGRPIGTVAADIKAKAANIALPQGISIEYLGEVKNQGEAFASLGLALLIAILLVYLIMVALYDSIVYPFVVLFSIPVALIGALLALALTMETLNIFSIIGIIMLLGLVSKNAILIVDFANQLKAEGHTVTKALIEAGKERLRPILMTTLAMILGMLPIALAEGAGSEIKKGMAWVIIGGLTSSMILTLFVVPAMYLIVEIPKDRWAKRRIAKKATPMKLSTVIILALTLISKSMFAQSQEELYRKKMMDSIKRVYILEAAIRNPALRRVIVSTDLISRGQIRSKLKGNKILEAKQMQIRTTALVTLPIKTWKRNSLSATFSFFNQQYDLNHIEAFVPNNSDIPSSATLNKTAAGLSISYQRIDSLFGKTVIYMANASALTSKLGEVHQYSIMAGAMLMLKQTATSSFALGMILNYSPSINMPVAPLFIYWRKLGADLELNVNLPQQLRLRKTLSKQCWASFGTSLSGTAAFFNNSFQGIPSKINYSSMELKTGPGMEFRFARYLMLGLNAGIMTPMMSRVYERYESSKDYFISNKIRATPFANITLSLLPVF